MINEFDSPQSEMSSMANANAYGDKTAQTNKDPQIANNDSPPTNPFSSWQYVPTQTGDKLAVYQAGDYYVGVQADGGAYKYLYADKRNLPTDIKPDDLFNYAKVKAGTWKPLPNAEKLGAPIRYDTARTKEPLKSLRPTLGYSWNGGNTTNPPTLGKGDKHTTLPSTNVPIDRTVSPDTESDWLTKLSNATSVIVDIGVEIIDLSPLGDLSRIIIGTDVRGNPVSLAERLMTAGCLLIPGSKYAVKAVDAATTIVKKGGKIADTIVKKGSATVKKLANELDKHLPITPNAPSPIPALEGISNVPQWLDDQFTKGVAKVETTPSIGKSNRAKTTTTQSNKTTSKTTTTTNKQTPPNPDPKKTEKPSSKPEHTKEKLPSEAEIKSELDELSKAMNDAGGEINPAMNDRVNILLDQLNRHQQLASKQAADLQEKLRNLLKLRGLQANTLARIKNLLNQLQGNSEATTTTEPTTTAPQTATPLEANFKDLTIEERIKQLQQRKKDGAITSLEEQELGNLEFAKQQNNVEELRKRIEEIEKDNSMESVDKERLLKLLREKLAELERGEDSALDEIATSPLTLEEALQKASIDARTQSVIIVMGKKLGVSDKLTVILGSSLVENKNRLGKMLTSHTSKKDELNGHLDNMLAHIKLGEKIRLNDKALPELIVSSSSKLPATETIEKFVTESYEDYQIRAAMELEILNLPDTRMGEQEEYESIAAAISKHREKIETHNKKKREIEPGDKSTIDISRRNIAYASGDFNRGKLEYTLNGKFVISLDQGAQNSLDKEENIFQAQWVSRKGAMLDENQYKELPPDERKAYWQRHVDAEFNIMDGIAKSLGAKRGEVYPEVTGRLLLASEMPYCVSCQDVIRQFKTMFPNVKLVLINGTRAKRNSKNNH